MGEPIVEQVRYRPPSTLAPFVASYTGYRLAGLPAGVHPGLPSTSLTFIVSFDAPLDVAAMPGGRQAPETFWAMVGGLHTRPATVRHDGRQHGVQIELTPTGSVAVFGVRPADLASTIVHVDDLDARFARELVERLSAADSWTRRFAELDALLERTVGTAVPAPAAIPPAAADAWRLLHEARGAISVGGLAAELGWSRRHLTEQFRRAYGIGPKECASVIRFGRAQALLRGVQPPKLATVAAECGYADQSHLTRDWNRFAGCSPSAWLADDLPYLQDQPVEL